MKISIPIRIGIIAILLLVIAGMQYALGYSQGFLIFYTRHIFLPLQKYRSYLLDKTDFSVGDILYLLLALLLLLIVIRTIFFAITFKKNKPDFWVELLRLITFPLTIYLLFIILWGGNYVRPALSSSWQWDKMKWDKETVLALNEELLAKLNEESKEPLFFPEDEGLNNTINGYYHARFGTHIPPLKVKATSLGYMLNYLGIQGYYNPLSGEGQFNRFIPGFMHPFVIAHEMAHQTGIAAEDDANLIAYIICSESDALPVKYSAHFNLFLYAFSELRIMDRAAAKQVFDRLNKNVRADIEELRRMNRKYRSGFRKVSNSLYDEYLRMHGQTDGIDSYSLVTRWAYFWEHHEKQKADLKVCP